jgi:hypothetical protein
MQSTIEVQGTVLKVEHQMLADALHASVYGGSGIELWCSIIRYESGENPSHHSAAIIDEDDRPQQVTIDTIRLGIERVLNNPPVNKSTSSLGATYYQMYTWIKDAVEDNDATMIDAETADLIVQFGLYGELVYG